MDENTVFSLYNESVVCDQFIAESLVNLDKRNTNKGIVLHKKLQPFLYICILSLVLQIYPKIYICTQVNSISRTRVAEHGCPTYQRIRVIKIIIIHS